MAEDGDAVAADLGALEDVDEAGLFGGGGAHARERGRVDDAAEAAEVELGEDLEDGDVEPVEVVQRELADGGAGDDHFYARVGDLLEDLVMCPSARKAVHEIHIANLFEVFLLASREVEHLLLVVDENRSFRLSLCNVQPAREHRDLGLCDLLDHTYVLMR